MFTAEANNIVLSASDYKIDSVETNAYVAGNEKSSM